MRHDGSARSGGTTQELALTPTPSPDISPNLEPNPQALSLQRPPQPPKYNRPLSPPPSLCASVRPSLWRCDGGVVCTRNGDARYGLQGAQGEVKHDSATGLAAGVTCKNVELGVLFHSSAERAYYAEPPLGWDCSSCCCCCCCCLDFPRSDLGWEATRHSSADAPPLPCSEVMTATAAAAVAHVTPTKEDGEGRRRWRQRRGDRGRGRGRGHALPRAVPLPVPFCLSSEDYADREGGSPYVRFPPFMHDLGGSPR